MLKNGRFNPQHSNPNLFDSTASARRGAPSSVSTFTSFLWLPARAVAGSSVKRCQMHSMHPGTGKPSDPHPVSRGSFFQTKPIIRVEERPPSAPVVAFIRVQNPNPLLSWCPHFPSFWVGFPSCLGGRVEQVGVDGEGRDGV